MEMERAAGRGMVAMNSERESPGGGEFSLGDLIGFLERHYLVILGAAILLALVVGIVQVVLVDPSYKSTATLVIFQPPVSSKLEPEVLSVHGYQRLLQSDAVLAETSSRLTTAGLREEEHALKLGVDVDSRIFVSKRQDTTSLAPILEAIGWAGTPELAAAVANTWAEVFLEQAHSVSKATASAGVEFAQRQYPSTKAELEELEQERVRLADEFETKLHEALTAGDRRIAAFEKQTTDLVSNHQTESRRQIEALVRDGLGRLEGVGGGIQDSSELSQVGSGLQQLGSLRALQAQTAPVVVLEKAITDDALWQSLLDRPRGKVDSAPTENLSLLTEELNPVFTDLAARAADIETKLRQSAVESRDVVADVIQGLESMQRMRSAGLSKLQAERSLELVVLERRQAREAAAIGRERDFRLGQISREIEQQEALETELRADFNEAVFAQAQQEVEAVHLAARAVPVLVPEGRGTIVRTVLAAALGLALGVGLSLFREVRLVRRQD